jgi:pilus assembly protein CpaC
MDTGVTVDFLPIVLGNGNVRLEVRPVVRELDETVSIQISPGVFAPGFTERKVDTGVEMKPGQTLALAGLVQSRVIANKTGFPWIGDLPYFGVPFRRVKQTTEDVELLIIVTPELVAATDCAETPQCMPGMHTDVPNDCQMYLKGYIEVPTKGPCGPQGCSPTPVMGPGNYEGGQPGMMYPGGSYESIPSGAPTPAMPGQTMYNANPNGAANTAYTAPPTRVAEAPVTGTLIPSAASATNPSNHYNPPRSQVQPASGGTSGAGKSPGYIGPVGYDVFN